jgi:hypothetical protein
MYQSVHPDIPSRTCLFQGQVLFMLIAVLAKSMLAKTTYKGMMSNGANPDTHLYINV